MSFWATETDRTRERVTDETRVHDGYLIEVAPDSFEPTDDIEAATHVHALDSESGEIVVAPIGTDTGGVRTFRVGSETYAIGVI